MMIGLNNKNTKKLVIFKSFIEKPFYLINLNI